MVGQTLLQRSKHAARAFKNGIDSLSFYEKLSLTISLTGTLSLFFILYQIHQTSASLQASAYATVGTLTLESDRIFIEKPYLREYFYRGKEIDETKYDEIMAVAEFQLDFIDATLTQLDLRPRENEAEMKEEEETWKSYFRSSFYRSPALCRRYNENRDWYRDNLKQIADEPCKKYGARIE